MNKVEFGINLYSPFSNEIKFLNWIFDYHFFLDKYWQFFIRIFGIEIGTCHIVGVPSLSLYFRIIL